VNASDEVMSLARRALTHVQNNTTDQAPTTMRNPVSAYLDPDRYAREIDRIFRRRPLALALSLELPQPRDYTAMTVVGVPVILVRGDDGVVRCFLNVCRHRGAAVCDEGRGTVARFLCKYHAWRYDLTGRLTAVTDPRKFGDFDVAANSLIELSCVEHLGLIWVVLTPGEKLDIEEWLCGFGPQLASLDLENWYLYEQRDLTGPGWKVTWDGYLEIYHHTTVHAKTLLAHTIGNILVHDTFGPHQRLVLARPTLREMDEQQLSRSDPQSHLRMIHSVFPNFSVSGILGDHALISQLLPGPTPDSTITRQTILSGKKPVTPEEKARTETFSRMALLAVRDEDYAVGATVQRGLASGMNTAVTYGRNEPAIQHYHRWVERLADDEASAV
jgi:phenylpropionate dioxygenase-like ring-hydroxylating dioxygenase large terminal subunit